MGGPKKLFNKQLIIWKKHIESVNCFLLFNQVTRDIWTKMSNPNDEIDVQFYEVAREFDALVKTLEESSNTEQSQDEPTTSNRQQAVALNELRVQMLEMLGTQKSNEDGRCCWVCFATDDDDILAAWVQPCKCSGTTKWVHQTCLQRWVDEKQKGNAFKRVNCPQCRTEYIIVFPEMGTFVSILEGIDSIIKRLSPFLAAGVIVGSLYWTAVTYGAVTVNTFQIYLSGFR